MLLYDLKTNDFCNMLIPIVLMMSRATTLMVIPLAVHRVVSVLHPFSYKRIRIIVLWIFALFAAVVFAVNYDLCTISSCLCYYCNC